MSSFSNYPKYSGKLTEAELRTVRSYDAMAASFDSSHKDKAFWLIDMRRFYELLPEGKVLEIGTGSGRDARTLRRLVTNTSAPIYPMAS